MGKRSRIWNGRFPGKIRSSREDHFRALQRLVEFGGTVLKSTTLTVIPGQSVPFSLRSDTDLIIAPGRSLVR
jgi:hypothetical protein